MIQIIPLGQYRRKANYYPLPLNAKSLPCLAVGVFLITLSMLSHGHSRALERSPIKAVGLCDFGVAYDVFVEGRIAYVALAAVRIRTKAGTFPDTQS